MDLLFYIWLLSPILGAIISRLSGGMKPKLPWKTDQILYAIPYVVLPLQLGLFWPWIVLSGVFAFVGKVTGHGQYMDLATWLRKVSPERLDFIVKIFFGDDPNVTQTTTIQQGNYWRDFFGLVVVGGFVGVGLFITLMVHGMYIPALLILLGSALKSVSYAVGWKVNGIKKVKELNEPTEIGEALTGFFGWGGVLLAKIMI